MDDELILENEIEGSLVQFSKSFSNDDLFSHKEIINEKSKKAVIFNDNVPGNNLNSKNKADNYYQTVIEPDFSPEKLKQFFDISGTLRTCITAYSINICGMGYEFIPEIEIIEEKGIKVYQKDKTPVPENILKEIDNEKSKITVFFENISLDHAWTKLQKLKRTLFEIYGNIYLEWECSADNELQGCILLESDEMRITKHESDKIEIRQLVKNPITLEYEEQIRFKSFRKFIQYPGINDSFSSTSAPIYFKEFGDPRIMNAFDGEYLKDENGNYLTSIPPGYIEKLKNQNKNFKIATEIMHLKIEDPGNLYGYGVPRWVSEIPSMLGVRSSDLANMNLLKNNGIPDFIMIIEGAKSDTIKKQIEDSVSQNKKLDKFGSLLIVSGDSLRTGPPGVNPSFMNPSIRIQPLNTLLEKEGMALTYSDKISERITGTFRLANLFIGKINEINRATAEIAKEQADEQVFSPERIDEDDIINKFLLSRLKIRYWKYRSKSYRMENKELRAKVINDMTQRGVLMPRDARKLTGKLLNEPLEEINEDFMNKPLSVYVMQNRTQTSPSTNNIEDTMQDKEENNSAKIIELKESSDSEVYTAIKKLIQKHLNFNVKDMYIYTK